MDIPTGIIAFGDQSFSGWVKAHVEKSETFSFIGNCEQADQLQQLVSDEKPRAVIVDLASTSASQAGIVGGEVQRGFKWASVLFLFESLSEEMVALSKSLRKRRWSFAGRELVDQVGIDRVLAGTLTDAGFIDSSVSAFETEMYEKSLEDSGDQSSDEEDDEDEGELDVAV